MGEDYPDWGTVTLSEVLTERKEKSTGYEQVHSVSVHKGVINQIEHLGRSFAAADTSKYNLVKPFDIIYTKSPTGNFPLGIIKYNQLDYNVIVSPLYGIFVPNNQYLGYLIHLYFESNITTYNFLNPLVQKGAKNTLAITNNKFLTGVLNLPTHIEEQQKIANCLFTLDELINAESAQLAHYQEYKKGLLQKLFPKEGQKVPELRFPGFSGDWGTVILSTITTPIKKKAKKGELHRVLTLSSEQGIISQDNYFGRQIASKDTERYIEVQENDFIYNDRITKESEYGTMRRLSKYSEGIVSPIYKCFRFHKDETPSFWEYYFSTSLHDDEYKKIANEGARSGRYNISVDKLLSSSVTSPSTKEQQKIAGCLSALDDLINTQQKQVDNLKEYKQGLMQALFPKVDKS